MSLARERGEVRVIIGFDVGFQPEGNLSETAAAGQRDAIAASQEAILGALSNAETVRRYETVPYMAATLGPDDLEAVLSAPGVTSVHEDIAVPPTLDESVALVNAKRLWAQGIEGTGQTVAVLDTGVRWWHGAFRDRTGLKAVASACFSSTTSQSTTLCRNGQDVMKRGADGFAAHDCDTSISGCGHGTHVGSIAVGYFPRHHGMARGSDILPIQVFSEFDCSGTPCALSWTSDQIAGLEFVYRWRNKYNIAAANMSLGGGEYDAPCNSAPQAAIIDNLRSGGVATVIASGNDGFNSSVGSPSCISSAITVGSTTKSDDVSSFSNHDEMVDLLAPGSSILAADADGARNAFRTLSGTSMATPHVAGAVALLKSSVPTATVDEIERALECTGKRISDVNLPRPRIYMDRAELRLRKPFTREIWTFRNDRQLNYWEQILGNWGRAGNALQVSANTSNVWHLIESRFCTDEVVVNAVMARQDPDTSQYWNSGILLSSHADEAGNFSGLWFAYNVDPDDQTQGVLWEVNGYSGTADSGSATLLCSTDRFAGPALGSPRNLQVTKWPDGRLMFWIDGNRVCDEMVDSRFDYGHVSLVMAAPENDPDHVLTVDRVIMRPLGRDGIAGVEVAGDMSAAMGNTATAEQQAGASPAGAAAQ
ncbi:S8 family serine peptidase [Roseovarius salis]|uniref:S8 family peptidase n=1 Tax=Roseovarius salis TaxID=3376063 RepID=UPI0037C51D7E